MGQLARFSKTNQHNFALYLTYCRNITKEKDLVHSIHQLRVVSRKLANSLWVFKNFVPASDYDVCYKTFRKVIRLLGKARDVDVQLSLYKEYAATKAEDVIGKKLQHKLEKKREGMAGDIKHVVKPSLHKAFAKKVKETFAHLNKKLRAMDAGEIKRFGKKKIIKRLHALLGFEYYVANAEASKQLHLLRIEAKKLRFVLEALKPFLTNQYDPLSVFAVDVQKYLGSFHDQEEWIGFIEEGCKKMRSRPARAFLKRLKDYSAQEKSKCYRDFVKTWKVAKTKKLFQKVLLQS